MADKISQEKRSKNMSHIHGTDTSLEKTVRKYTSEYANFEIVQNELKKLNFKMELSN